MVFSIWNRVIIRNIGYWEPLVQGCSYPVRQNASFTWFAHRAFSSRGRPKKVYSAEISEKVKTLLKDNGFDDSHLSELARLRPYIFKLSAKNNILPKLNFFNSVGISSSELPKFILRRPILLTSNLENQIIPCYDFLRSMPICEDRFIRMLMCWPGILAINVNTCLSPNVELLRGMGLPESSITFLLTRYTKAVCRNHAKFRAFVNQLVTMGTNHLTKTFIQALQVLCSISKKTWERKLKLYKSFGLSDDDILIAFRKQPLIMAVSEKKIVKVMEFCVKTMSWNSSLFVRCPVLLLMNLERRTIPRCHVMELLINNGLVKKASPSTYLIISEKDFLIRYPHKFKDVLPELMEIYINKSSQGKMDQNLLDPSA